MLTDDEIIKEIYRIDKEANKDEKGQGMGMIEGIRIGTEQTIKQGGKRA